MFSLRNNDDLAPFKAPLINENDSMAMYPHYAFGPTFGGSWDLHIEDNAGSNTYSSTSFGLAYQPPPGYIRGTRGGWTAN